MTEAALQAQVIELARLCGWRVMHVRRSLGKGQQWTTATSIAGWPDLTLWHESRRKLLFIELKSEIGELSDEQTDVLTSLARAGQAVQVWRPSDWEHIQATLTGAACSA